MILLTLDTSSESETAATVAADLAARFDQPLHVLLVLDGALRAYFAELARDAGSTVEDEAAAYLAQAVDRLRATTAVPIESSCRHGANAEDTIVRVASEPDVVLVVMATHGRSGLSRLLAGSVTEHVVRNAPVPVVVVPAAPRGQEASASTTTSR